MLHTDPIEYVVLVNEKDQPIGTMEKIQAHKEGRLHRAFSVFIFNSANEMLLQKRATFKYHSPGLWTNTCCSHPREGEHLKFAAMRRLYEEMMIVATIKPAFTFIYNAALDNGLIEHEYDHVFIGKTDKLPIPDSYEVSDWRYISRDALLKEIEQHPYHFTEWFKICCSQYIDLLFDAVL
ncbi:MAG: isopentenyl-diphosphate Delta-isomerase [Chitinophagia bacterium]|nr:isopentenyl-diphosphate Delta-isomerase [Chitinophagia bacterium]